MFFGNCRMYFVMKKFVEKEVDIMINKVDFFLYYKKIFYLEKLKKKCQIFEIIWRDCLILVIFKDFKSYKVKKVIDKNWKVVDW